MNSATPYSSWCASMYPQKLFMTDSFSDGLEICRAWSRLAAFNPKLAWVTQSTSPLQSKRPFAIQQRDRPSRPCSHTMSSPVSAVSRCRDQEGTCGSEGPRLLASQGCSARADALGSAPVRELAGHGRETVLASRGSVRRSARGSLANRPASTLTSRVGDVRRRERGNSRLAVPKESTARRCPRHSGPPSRTGGSALRMAFRGVTRFILRIGSSCRTPTRSGGSPLAQHWRRGCLRRGASSLHCCC